MSPFSKIEAYSLPLLCISVLFCLINPAISIAQKPNILIVLSDDHSFPHASAYGSGFIETPAFDRVANEGVLFMNGWSPVSSCSPSRASMLTGRYPWQIEQAGTHDSSFPKKYTVFPDLLEDEGYWIGYTGKGWGPGDWKVSGRDRNPAGPAFQELFLEPDHNHIVKTDYAGNFELFLEQRPDDKPFYFWMGIEEPHRPYEKGVGLKEGKRLEDVDLPAYYPDIPEIRSDLLDYAVEIEWFDSQLAIAMSLLEERGELDNTIIIVTADQGMPFPRAKANLYEDALHIPLAIRWGNVAPPGRTVDDLVSLIDIMPTILEATGAKHPGGEYPVTGRSFMDILKSNSEGLVDPARIVAYSGRERHSSARWKNKGYPQRSIRTQQYLYIRNYKPERWPAGAPRYYWNGLPSFMHITLTPDSFEPGELTPMHVGYHEIDTSPTLDVMAENVDDPYISRFLHLSVGKRPAEELYDILKDPGCINNLALDPDYEPVTSNLRNRLHQLLVETGDPQTKGNGDIWDTESYSRLSGASREFPAPEWALPLEED